VKGVKEKDGNEELTKVVRSFLMEVLGWIGSIRATKIIGENKRRQTKITHSR
jgi:hypothetical protein